MRVIVVGAGIGGLSVAIALRRSGHEAVVLERAPQLEAIGAGLTLFGNAMSALERIGARGAVAARGAPASSSAILTREGAVLAHVPADLLAGTVAVHRAELQAVLAETAGEIRLGAEVVLVEQAE